MGAQHSNIEHHIPPRRSRPKLQHQTSLPTLLEDGEMASRTRPRFAGFHSSFGGSTDSSFGRSTPIAQKQRGQNTPNKRAPACQHNTPSSMSKVPSAPAPHPAQTKVLTSAPLPPAIAPSRMHTPPAVSSPLAHMCESASDSDGDASSTTEMDPGELVCLLEKIIEHAVFNEELLRPAAEAFAHAQRTGGTRTHAVVTALHQLSKLALNGLHLKYGSGRVSTITMSEFWELFQTDPKHPALQCTPRAEMLRCKMHGSADERGCRSDVAEGAAGMMAAPAPEDLAAMVEAIRGQLSTVLSVAGRLPSLGRNQHGRPQDHEGHDGGCSRTAFSIHSVFQAAFDRVYPTLKTSLAAEIEELSNSSGSPADNHNHQHPTGKDLGPVRGPAV